MSKTFRQFDARWKNKGYPRKPDLMLGSGCGPTAVADLIVNNAPYKKKTPNHVRKWMVKHGYAIPGQGTLWDGIDAALKHYGFVVRRHDNMQTFFKEMSKKGVRGIILFVSGTKGGVTWTTSGHFVAVTDYRTIGGKHDLYTRDPGPRCHDGWHRYETTMKGLVRLCWTCYLPEEKTEEKKAGVKKAETNKNTVSKKTATKDIKASYKVLAKEGMNVRKSNTKYSGKIKAIPYGTKFRATKQHGNWVYAPAYSGWICVKGKTEIYLKKV